MGVMARYYFDTHDGDHLVTDEEGLECGGTPAIRSEALNALSDMAHDVVPKSPHHPMLVSVRDKEGHVVLRATLSLDIDEHPSHSA